MLASRGYLRVDQAADADVILINTCAIREHAEQPGEGADRPAAAPSQGQSGPGAGRDRVAWLNASATICSGSARPGSISSRAPTRTGAWAISSSAIQENAIERGQTLLELDSDENYEGVDSVRASGVSAWITVQRGCDHRCTFCIVPYVRGAEKNRQPAAILDEVRGAVDAGFSEVVLLGQTVNSYRYDDWDFARLLREVGRVDGIRRVRFTSPHPNDVDEALLRVMAEEAAVCRQLHLPVQSGSDRILKRMVRRYTSGSFLQKVDLARSMVPDLALSTDVIVAFPGETPAEYEETLDLMRRVRFDEAYLYKYSLRDGTPATRLPDSDFVPDDVGSERLQRLIEVQRAIQREIAESEVGQEREVLIEREARSEGDMLGRTEQNKTVAFPAPPDAVGEYRDVRLTGTTGATFTGVACG